MEKGCWELVMELEGSNEVRLRNLELSDGQII